MVRGAFRCSEGARKEKGPLPSPIDFISPEASPSCLTPMVQPVVVLGLSSYFRNIKEMNDTENILTGTWWKRSHFSTIGICWPEFEVGEGG